MVVVVVGVGSMGTAGSRVVVVVVVDTVRGWASWWWSLW